MLETKTMGGAWPRQRFIEKQSFRYFTEGSRVDAMDYQGRWFRGEVRRSNIFQPRHSRQLLNGEYATHSQHLVNPYFFYPRFPRSIALYLPSPSSGTSSKSYGHFVLVKEAIFRRKTEIHWVYFSPCSPWIQFIICLFGSVHVSIQEYVARHCKRLICPSTRVGRSQVVEVVPKGSSRIIDSEGPVGRRKVSCRSVSFRYSQKNARRLWHHTALVVFRSE